MSFNRDDLERVTRDYWDRSQRYDLDSCLKIYICEGQKRLGNKSLLEAELKYAKDNRFITAEPCETLVLLVGYSLEPL
ncbi:MAG TPA: CRISPR-associated protein, partial [Syntrophaceticus sp.]|nr:CRISPR-associated protein [Syntrophaceticus sp.]